MISKKDLSSTISFYGGVGDVTGANFVLRHQGVSIMVDCGMFQGSDDDIKKNYEPFDYQPADIDVLVVTHAHADHIGRIPKLVRDGFRGKIYSTTPTRELAEIMFEDSVRHIARYQKEHHLARPLYDQGDVATALGLWHDVAYHTPQELPGGCLLELFDAGHILGSAMAVIDCAGIKVGFTGDLGNSPAPLLRDTEPLVGLDYLVMESVYGDRNHEERELRSSKFFDALEKTIRREGVVLIPAFSLERTQEILFEINNLIEGGKLDRVPVYMDSPLAAKVTEVYRRGYDFFKPETQRQIDQGDNIFDFPGLVEIGSVAESKEIVGQPGAKVIIAGSGMSTGGRIVHHEKQHLGDPRNTIIFVGYQAAGTLGRIIQEGAPSAYIYGDQVDIKAETVTISGYSGHKQRDDLIAFVQEASPSLKKVWCVMGEYQASAFLAQRLHEYVGVDARVPKKGEAITLS